MNRILSVTFGTFTAIVSTSVYLGWSNVRLLYVLLSSYYYWRSSSGFLISYSKASLYACSLWTQSFFTVTTILRNELKISVLMEVKPMITWGITRWSHTAYWRREITIVHSCKKLGQKGKPRGIQLLDSRLMGFLSFISYVYLEDLFVCSPALYRQQNQTNWIPKSPKVKSLWLPISSLVKKC